jgi:serine/threonine-protein phosphatase PPG1
MASILEVSPGGQRYFNVFEAAPENERDGPNQQQQQVKAIEYFL